MEVKKGYKQTEVGVIPEDWEVRKVGDICDFIVPGRNKPKYFNGDIPWITTPDIDGNTVCFSKQNLFITKDEAKSVGSKIVPKNSVIISCVGDLGLVTIAGNDLVINQQLHAFLPNDKINNKYLHYALMMQQSYMESIATKTAVPYMNKDNCNSIPIPIPPTKAEQTAIATTLSDADALIQSLEKLIAKKRLIKHGAMQQLLTCKKRLPGFSGKWEYISLEAIAQKKDYSIVDGPFGSQMKVSEFVEEGIPVIEMEHLEDKQSLGVVTRFITKQKFEIIKRSAIYPSDIVISKTGTLGLIGVVPAYISKGIITSRLAKISVDCSKANISFVFHWLRKLKIEGFWEKVSQGGTMQILGIKMLKEAPFPNIDLPEQTAVVQVLSDMDAEIEELEQKLDKYKMIKQGMMQELLTGKTRLI